MQSFRIAIAPDFDDRIYGLIDGFLGQRTGHAAGMSWSRAKQPADGLVSRTFLDSVDAYIAMLAHVSGASVAGGVRCAVVARWGVGYDRIDVPALSGAGVALTITPNAVRVPVAEGILSFIFALAKNIREQDTATRNGAWKGGLSRPASDIAGKTLGSIGCGNIALTLFSKVQSLSFARLIAFDPWVSTDAARSRGVELTDLNTVMAESDFLTINVPLNNMTRGIVGASQLALMKPTAFIVNTARGGIVDEDALARALEDRQIAGAGIDVFEREPPPENHRLFGLDNVWVSPHAIAHSHALNNDVSSEVVENVLAVARGETPPGLVDAAVALNPLFIAKLKQYRGNVERQ